MLKRKSTSTNVQVFYRLLDAAIQKKFCWKAILKKIVKFTRKLLLWSAYLVMWSWTPLWLFSWQISRKFSEQLFYKNISGRLTASIVLTQQYKAVTNNHCLIIQVKITTFQQNHFLIYYSTFRVILHSLSRNCFKSIFYKYFYKKVDIHITVTNELKSKIKQYCYENKRLKY